MPQVKVGWRSGAVAAPSVSTILLDTYSGAAAAYSLRKLSSTYTGSAIRVRRSSDNTELNIGFDSDGNLDTVALSSFVGSGSGFVTTWYDQTGNNFNRTQTTATAQPNIVYLGAINMVNGKPAMYFDGTGTTFALQGPKIGETWMGAGYSSTVLNVTKLDSSYSSTAEYPLFGGTGWYDSRFSINSNKWYLINTGTGISSTVNASANQVVSSVVFEYTTDKVRINGTEVISGNVGTNGGTDYNFIGRSWLGKFYKGYFQEHIIYASDKTSVISEMESNMNTYYSVYPNPTSVWNLLTAAYNADSIGSSSLKTSLVAAYNGESNANDSFGTNNGTAVGGLTYTTGKIGDAFQFNGSTSYVSLPNDSLNFTGDFTVNAWFNSSTYTGLRGIASSYKVVGSLAYGWIANHDDSLNKFGLYFRDGSNTMLYRTYAGVPLNSYHMITWVRKVGQDPKIYINGVYSPGEYTFGNSSSNPSYQTGQPCNLGGWNNTSYGNHKQDATNFWSKALTISEITELYNSGNGAQYIGDNFYKPTTNNALGTNNGTAQGGLTYGVGKVGTAFVFNGTNSQIDFTADTMNIGDTFSISYWGYYVNNSSNGQCVLSNYYETGGKWGFFIYTSNGIHYLNRFNGTTQYSLQSTVIPINTWKHFVFTRKANSTKIYVDGVLVASDTNSAVTAYNVLCKPRIGSREITGVWRLASGTNIDALNVWNKELTATEVTELYNSGNGKQYPN